MAEVVLLTSQFPFGIETEPFLEAELPILAQRFDRIYVLPSTRADGVRPLPQNVELVEMPWLSVFTRNAKRQALASVPAAHVVLSTLRAKRDLKGYFRSVRMYADILSGQVIKARYLVDFVHERSLRDAIFYDYWFENSTLALALCRRSGAVSAAVARAHRFDVFDEAWDGRPVPFRDVKAMNLDAIYPVSDAGARYLADKVPEIVTKLAVHRLGAADPGTASPAKQTDEPHLVVTCSRLAEVKRIDLVPRVLAAMEEPVRWVHIGDGPEREHVERVARDMLLPERWRLLGRLDNAGVLDFYRSNSVQALLSVSSSEGVPVSMMEAQSFGIPIVACDVGGVSEIVSDRTGRLVSKDASVGAIADALTACLNDNRLSRAAIRSAFAERYDARVNYGHFADAIITLHEANVAGI